MLSAPKPIRLSSLPQRRRTTWSSPRSESNWTLLPPQIDRLSSADRTDVIEAIDVLEAIEDNEGDARMQLVR